METSEYFEEGSREESEYRARTFGESSGAELRQAADELSSSFEELYRVTESLVRRQMNARPYAVLGAAAGLGFVLGGGLSSRISSGLLRMWGSSLVARVLDDFVPAVTSSSSMSEER